MCYGTQNVKIPQCVYLNSCVLGFGLGIVMGKSVSECLK